MALQQIRRLAFALAFALVPFGCGGVDGPSPCDADADCFDGYACDTAQTSQCLRACTTDGDCVAAEHCDIPAGADQGVCRAG